MIRLRRASVIVALSLLASTATAYAECAWVLWVEWALPDAPSHLATGLIPVGGFTTKKECELGRAERRAQQAKHSSVFCLPDTVDPRGPKGK